MSRPDTKISFSDSGLSVLQSLVHSQPDLVIASSRMRDIAIESFCSEVINRYPQLPIIVLVRVPHGDIKLKLLEMGIDNVLEFPVEPEILNATINSKLVKLDRIESNGNGEMNTLIAGGLVLNTSTYEVTCEGKELVLTQTEFNLLKLLIINQGMVLSREKVLNALWGYSNEVDTRVVDVHIGHLRKKIKEICKKEHIQTVTGFGYKLVAD